MNYCILTPTYSGHFKYIEKYLQSFCKYVSDHDKIPIYFILTDLSEKNQFEKIIKPYQNILSLHVLYFSDILKAFNVDEIPDLLLFKYGRYSYQTLKKLYAMLWIKADKFLVLDSESMWIRNTNMTAMFDLFFKEPFIMGSSVKQRFDEHTETELMKKTLKAVETVLNVECKYIFQEHFTWFYTYDIIEDLCKQYGSPLEMVKKVYKYEISANNRVFGLMELSLLHEFIFLNASKYHYKFINIEEELETCMGKNLYNKYREFWRETFYGQFGFIEFPFSQLRKEFVKPLGQFFKKNNIFILRCRKSSKAEYSLQKKFVFYAAPKILAASQGHWFGLDKKRRIFIGRA